jgi:competence protein ComEA
MHLTGSRGIRAANIRMRKEEKEMIDKRSVWSIVFCLAFVCAFAAGLSAQTAQKVNVNTATAAELAQVPGISPETAKAIVETRAKTGALTSAGDLMKVPGMTEAGVKAVAPSLSFAAPKGGGDEEEVKLPRY